MNTTVKEQISGRSPQRLQTRNVGRDDLLPLSDVLSKGFAGHTLDDYPEPARSYHIAYSRLCHLLILPVPLLVLQDQELIGIMNSIWSTRVGIIPVRRVGKYELEVPDERLTFITGEEAIGALSFSTDEILITVPSWCRGRELLV